MNLKYMSIRRGSVVQLPDNRREFVSDQRRQLAYPPKVCNKSGTCYSLKLDVTKPPSDDQGQFVTKPAEEPRSVLKVTDYMYYTQFDQQAFRAIPFLPAPCEDYRYPATRTIKDVDTADGKNLPLDSIKVVTP